MNALPPRFHEDKALRDAAKAVLDADLAHFKASLDEQGIGGRVKDQITGKMKRRVVSGARDVLAQAKEQASDHRGVLAVLVGALIMWLAREPLLGWLGFAESNIDDDAPSCEPVVSEAAEEPVAQQAEI